MSFHLAIAVLMGLLSFAAFFIAAELALISDEEYRRIARLIHAQSHSLWEEKHEQMGLEKSEYHVGGRAHQPGLRRQLVCRR
jgi:hypothetical protein